MSTYQRKHHYIYKITRDDGRYYIGMHSTDDLDDGYFGSGVMIIRSIKKHGLERHTKEILEQCSSREELKDREKELITEEILNDPLCMNLKYGGEGGNLTPSVRAKIRIALTGKKATPSACAKMSAKAIGRKNSDTAKKKLSAARKKPCTVDGGITIYPSRADLIKSLGKGKTGCRSATFTYV